MALRPLEITRPTRWIGLHISWPSIAEHRVLFILLAITLVRGVLYAVLNPPFGSPDERAHFMYVQHLATGGTTPKGAEGHQPVPYYAMMVPAYLLTSGQPEAVQLLAIRLLSLTFLLGVALFTWLAARRLAPEIPFVRGVACSLVALHPQLAYIGASANNDNAANFMGAVLVFVVVAAFSERRTWFIPISAVAAGTAIMTKGQILPMVAISLLAVTGRVLLSSTGRTRSLAAATLLLFGLLATASLRTNEGAILIVRAQQELSALQRWDEVIREAREIGLQALTYQITSFWAAFQGEALRPRDEWYVGPVAVTFVGPIGYLAHFLRNRNRGSIRLDSSVWLRAALLAMVIAQWLLPYLWHLMQRVSMPDNPWLLQLLQGRYMLLFMPAAALLVAEGWHLLLGRRGTTAVWATITGTLIALDASSLLTLANHWQVPFVN